MATPADELKWNSIFAEVRTTITTATPDAKEKLRIATQKVNVRSYVREKNGRFNVKIRGFGKHRNIGTFPNEKGATLAYAITKMKLGPKKRYPKKRPARLSYCKTPEQKRIRNEAAEKKKKEIAARKVERKRRKKEKIEIEKVEREKRMAQPKQKRRKYQKTEVQKLKELVRVNTTCVVDVYPYISVVI